MNVDELDTLELHSDGEYDNPNVMVAMERDAQIAERECKKCGKKRSYRAVLNSGTYRAFSVCVRCDDVYEF